MPFGFGNSLPSYRAAAAAGTPTVSFAYGVTGDFGFAAGAVSATYTPPTGTHLALVSGGLFGAAAANLTATTGSGFIQQIGGGTSVYTQNGSYIISDNTRLKLASWYVLSPPTPATTANLHYNYASTAPDEVSVTGAYFTGVSQTTPFGTAVTAQGTKTTSGTVSGSVTVTTAVGDYVCVVAGFIDLNNALGTISSPTATVLSSAQPTLYSSLSGQAILGIVATTTSTTVTVNCTTTATPSASWQLQAFVIKAG